MRRFLSLIGLTCLTASAAAAAGALLMMAAMLPIGPALGAGTESGLIGATQAGHEQGTPRYFAPKGACLTLDAVVQIIARSHVSGAAVEEFYHEMLLAGTCKEFSKGLRFWPVVVITELKWGDGDPMWIIQGHDDSGDGRQLYIWMTVSRARVLRVPPPGLSSTPVA